MNAGTAIATRILGTTLTRYFLVAGGAFVFFYLLFPFKAARMKIQKRLAGKKDFFREIGHSAQTSIVITAAACLLLLTPLKQHSRVYDHINDFPVWYLALSVVISLIIHDTYFYWMHRVLHHKKLFKLIHRTHHKSTNPSPWTSYSFHVLEAVTEGGVLFVIAFTIPIHLTAIFLFTTAAFLINVYGHLGYEVMPKKFRYSWLFGIITTSVYHNLHHSKFKGNYGLYFRIWDRLMSTENPIYVAEYDKVQAKRFSPSLEQPPVNMR
ncbi:MAG: sterol desaturase family protein [Niabella sp.]|nr:sterol desaturase family protein [Niabella sp.]